jgi:plasmid maintenance system antidote protein VapI
MPRGKGVKTPGAQIAVALKELNATQASLCTTAKVAPAAIKGILDGKKAITPGIAVKVGKALKLSAAELLAAQAVIDIAREEVAAAAIKPLKKVEPKKPAAKPAAKAVAAKPAGRKPGRKPAGSQPTV